MVKLSIWNNLPKTNFNKLDRDTQCEPFIRLSYQGLFEFYNHKFGADCG